MRGKDFSTGLRGVLFEAKHYERMGAAVWLYGWLVLRQTRQEGSTGWVLGGKPISYREIESETGFAPRTLERWMRVLRRAGYVETDTAAAGVIVRITKAKKFWRGTAAKNEGRVRNCAESGPQISVGDRADSEHTQLFLPGIGSGYVVREEKEDGSCLGKEEKPQRRELQFSPRGSHELDPLPPERARVAGIWRRQRKEELVRRELGVGQGPQLVRRGS